MKDMHLHEDFYHPENRVNITLFHLLAFEYFGNFFKKSLGLPLDCIIDPSPNLVDELFGDCGRPDFKVTHNGKVIGYIEVELGQENKVQVSSYKEKLGVKIYSVVGKKTDRLSGSGGDISLEEVNDHLTKLTDPINSQLSRSIHLFQSLIHEYIILGRFRRSYQKSPLSEEVSKCRIITIVRKHFGDRFIESGTISGNQIRPHCNSPTSLNFGLQVYSRKATKHEFSLLTKRGNYIYFPSKVKLLERDYFPHRKNEVTEYVNLIVAMGADEIEHLEESKTAKLPIEVVEASISELCIAIDKIISPKTISH